MRNTYTYLAGLPFGVKLAVSWSLVALATLLFWATSDFLWWTVALIVLSLGLIALSLTCVAFIRRKQPTGAPAHIIVERMSKDNALILTSELVALLQAEGAPIKLHGNKVVYSKHLVGELRMNGKSAHWRGYRVDE